MLDLLAWKRSKAFSALLHHKCRRPQNQTVFTEDFQSLHKLILKKTLFLTQDSAVLATTVFVI
jgi:hypothetical protein